MLSVLDALWDRACAGCGAASERLCPTCAADLRLREIPVEGLRCWALASYDSGVARALRRAKLGGDRALMALLADRFAHEAASVAASFDAIVPAPSAWNRRLERGFAPAAVLAAALSARSGVPMCHALAISRGAKQATLGAEKRRANLAGRLRSVRPAPGRILVVDDVVTTGSTLGACARELLGDASGSVTGLALCATPLSRPGRHT